MRTSRPPSRWSASRPVSASHLAAGYAPHIEEPGSGSSSSTAGRPRPAPYTRVVLTCRKRPTPASRAARPRSSAASRLTAHDSSSGTPRNEAATLTTASTPATALRTSAGSRSSPTDTSAPSRVKGSPRASSRMSTRTVSPAPAPSPVAARRSSRGTNLRPTCPVAPVTRIFMVCSLKIAFARSLVLVSARRDQRARPLGPAGETSASGDCYSLDSRGGQPHAGRCEQTGTRRLPAPLPYPAGPRRRGPRRGGQAPYPGAAPGGGGPAGRDVGGLLHAAGAGPRPVSVAADAHRAGPRAADDRGRAGPPVPPGGGGAAA